MGAFGLHAAHGLGVGDLWFSKYTRWTSVTYDNFYVLIILCLYINTTAPSLPHQPWTSRCSEDHNRCNKKYYYQHQPHLWKSLTLLMPSSTHQQSTSSRSMTRRTTSNLCSGWSYKSKVSQFLLPNMFTVRGMLPDSHGDKCVSERGGWRTHMHTLREIHQRRVTLKCQQLIETKDISWPLHNSLSGAPAVSLWLVCEGWHRHILEASGLK